MPEAASGGPRYSRSREEGSLDAQRQQEGRRSASRNAGLSACVINWNGERYLAETVGAVLGQGSIVDEVVVVDNASTDASLRLVTDRFPSVRALSLPRNLGPAAARNAGLRACRGSRVLFVDNDTVLDPSCAQRLADALDADPRAVAAAPRVLWAGQPDTIHFDGADGHYLGLMTLRHANRPAAGVRPETCTTDSLVSACFLFDRARFGPAEPFDERLFIFFEDHDFGLRCRLAGHRLLSVGGARAFHREGTPGLSLRPGGRPAARRLYYSMRNRWLVLLQDYELRSLVLFAPILLVFEIFQLAGVMARGWVREWLAAALWIAQQRREILRRRRQVQATRRLPDRQILHGGTLPLRDELARGPLLRAGRRVLDRLAAAWWLAVRPAL
jgi:hypothetical protein